MKEKTQPRILYLPRISFKTEGEIKIFLDKQKPRDHCWQTWPMRKAKEMLQAKMKKHQTATNIKVKK